MSESKTPPQYIRIYTANNVSCMNCENWEEIGYDEQRHHLNEFTFNADKDESYTCNKCGSNCVKESLIREFRDFE